MLTRDDAEIFIGSINNIIVSDIIRLSFIRASYTIYI